MTEQTLKHHGKKSKWELCAPAEGQSWSSYTPDPNIFPIQISQKNVAASPSQHKNNNLFTQEHFCDCIMQ